MRSVFYHILSLFGDAFANPRFSITKLSKHVFLQKILRFNSHVPWPVDPSSKIVAPEKINRGNRCPGLSQNCHIDGRNGIIFGKNVWIGPDVKIVSMNHDLTHYPTYLPSDPIKIGNDCWIGAGAIILPGVSIADHTVVGAGSVVTKSFESADILIAGNPARVIKSLPPYKKDSTEEG